MTTVSCYLPGHLHKKPSSTRMSTSSQIYPKAAIPTSIHTFVKTIQLIVSLKGNLQSFFGHTTNTFFLFSYTHRMNSFIMRLCDPSHRHLQMSELAYACYTVHR